MEFTTTFLLIIYWSGYLVLPVIVFLTALILLLGLLVRRIERWEFFDAIYWAFITATTVGYGDIRPLKKASKILSILLAIIGLMLTGIIIAITVNATTLSLEKHKNETVIEIIKQNLE